MSLEERIYAQIAKYIDDEMDDDEILDAIKEHVDISDMIDGLLNGPNPSEDVVAAVRKGLEADIENMDLAGEDLFEDELREAVTKIGTHLIESQDPTLMKAINEKVIDTIVADTESYCENNDISIAEVLGEEEWNAMLRNTLVNDPESKGKLESKLQGVLEGVIEDLDDDSLPSNDEILKLLNFDDMIQNLSQNHDLVDKVQDSLKDAIVDRFSNFEYDDLTDQQIEVIESVLDIATLLSEVLYQDHEKLAQLKGETKDALVRMISSNRIDLITKSIEESKALLEFVNLIVQNIIQEPEVRKALGERVRSSMTGRSTTAIVDAVVAAVVGKIAERVANAIMA
jgi:hypothetical protein